MISVELRKDLLDPAELTASTRGELLAADEADLTAQLLPNEFAGGIQVEFTVNDRPADQVTPLRAWDGPSSRVGAQKGEERYAKTVPNSAVAEFGEEEYLLFANHAGDSETLLEHLAGKRRQVFMPVLRRIRQLRSEALLTGRLAINENGVHQNVDFGRNPEFTAVSPASWTDAEANPFEYIETLVEAYAEENKVEPEVAIIGRRALSAMTRNPNIIAAFPQGTQVTGDAVNGFLEAEGLPRLLVNRNREALTPETLLFATPGADRLGSTVWGPTKEVQTRDYGLEQAEYPGIAVGVYSQNDPAIELFHAVANYLPLLKNANFSLAATVVHD